MSQYVTSRSTPFGQGIRDVRIRFDSWKNRFFWSKNRYFELILYYSIFIRIDSLPSELQPEWARHSAIQNFEIDDVFFVRNPVFSKNRMKMFLEISGNFSNNFWNGFSKKPYKNIVGFSYLLVLVMTKVITNLKISNNFFAFFQKNYTILPYFIRFFWKMYTIFSYVIRFFQKTV